MCVGYSMCVSVCGVCELVCVVCVCLVCAYTCVGVEMCV